MAYGPRARKYATLSSWLYLYYLFSIHGRWSEHVATGMSGAVWSSLAAAVASPSSAASCGFAGYAAARRTTAARCSAVVGEPPDCASKAVDRTRKIPDRR